MQLFCRSCGAEISADGINLQTMMAKCTKCNAVFSFADMYADIEPKAAKKANAYAYDIPQPGGVTMRHDGMDLVLVRDWNRLNGALALGFGVFWLVMLFVIMRPFFSDFPGSQMPVTFIFALFPFFGVYMMVSGLYGLLNQTMIRVGSGSLRTAHAPLPWPGKHFDAHDLEQLFVSQKVSTSSGRSGRSTTITYRVEAVTRTGERVKILQGLESPEQAQFIEQEIERYLRIEDTPVRGEYGRGY